MRMILVQATVNETHSHLSAFSGMGTASAPMRAPALHASMPGRPAAREKPGECVRLVAWWPGARLQPDEKKPAGCRLEGGGGGGLGQAVHEGPQIIGRHKLDLATSYRPNEHTIGADSLDDVQVPIVQACAHCAWLHGGVHGAPPACSIDTKPASSITGTPRARAQSNKLPGSVPATK